MNGNIIIYLYSIGLLELKLYKERANLSTLVEIFMKGGFITTKEVEMVEQYFMMDMFMMGNGKIIFGMVKEFILGLVVRYIKVNG